MAGCPFTVLPLDIVASERFRNSERSVKSLEYTAFPKMNTDHRVGEEAG